MIAGVPLPLPKVMDLLLDAICVVDAEGRYVFVNAAWERLLGYSREELIGRNMIEFVFSEDRERTLEAATNVMCGNPHLHFENRYVRKDGEVVHIMWSARWSESDRLRLAVARDVTALKRTERMRSALYEILEAAHVVGGFPELYERLHRIVTDLLPADKFYIALYDASAGTVSFPYFFDAHEPKPQSQPLIVGAPLAEVIRTGEVLLTNCCGPGTDGQLARAHDGASWLGAPLTSPKGIVGAVVLRREAGRTPYTEEDSRGLQVASARIAAAIERKQREARLLHLACHDALTDLPNRTLFDDRLDTALKRARRYSEHLALLYLDLNGFKRVNDTFGHEVGDRLLREAGQRLAQCVRASDTVGRMGGDEFAVLLTQIQAPADVNIVANKVCAAITAPFDLGTRTLAISASIGTAVYPEHGDARELLFRRADASMYAAKRARA